MTPLIVGVDAGGSSVAAVASRDGAISGRGRAGPANLTVVGAQAAVNAIASAVAQATSNAEIGAMYVGAAGAGRAVAASALREALRQRFPRVALLVVEDDARIALRAAIPDGPGVVVVAGTGSVAYAEGEAGAVRIGGCGYLVGDEGSALAIGVCAVRSLLRVYDGRREPDALTHAIAASLGVETRDAVLDVVYAQAQGARVDVASVAALAPVVIALAADGNQLARGIVEDAAHDLGQLAIDAARIAALLAPAVALSGGLLRRRSLLTDLVRATILRALPGSAFAEATEEPELAALRLARAAFEAKP